MSDIIQPILRAFLEIKNKALDVRVNPIADGKTDAANDLSARIRTLDVCIEQLPRAGIGRLACQSRQSAYGNRPD